MSIPLYGVETGICFSCFINGYPVVLTRLTKQSTNIQCLEGAHCIYWVHKTMKLMCGLSVVFHGCLCPRCVSVPPGCFLKKHLPLNMLFHSVFTILVHVWLCALHMNLRLIMLRNKLGSDSFIGLGNFAGGFNLGRTDIFISHPRTRNVFAFVLVCFSAFQMDFQIFSIEVLWLC